MTKKYKIFLFTSCLFATFCCEASQAVLSYETFQRLSTPQNQDGASNWFTLNFVTEKAKRRFDTFLDLSVRFYHGKEKYIASLPEGYLSFTNDNEQVILGRRILDWNASERFWALGQLNGLQGFTLLGQEQEGVSGLHYDYKSSNFKVSLLASYFFVPQMNPSLDIKDGKISSNTDWVKLPPKRTLVNNQIVPIYYDIKKPEVSEVVLQKTLGTNVAYLWKGGSLSAFGVYKPENNLRMNAEAFYDQKLDQVTVKADPFVSHHVMYGMQGSQEIAKNTTVQTGVQVNDPTVRLGSSLDFLKDKGATEKRNNFESKYFSIKPKYEKESYAYLSTVIDQPFFDISLNAIELLTDNQKSSDDLYSDTVKWHRAVGLGLGYDITESFRMNVAAQYDIQMMDSLFRNEYSYHFYKEMSLAMGLEIINSPRTDSYWSAYRANDTVYSTLSYTF